MQNNNSQSTNKHGDNILQKGAFGIGITKAVVENQHTTVGVGVNEGKIEADKLVENTVESQGKTIEIVAEVQQILQQLESSNLAPTPIGQMEAAKQALEIVEKNPSLKRRVIAALKSAGAEAFKKALNHPVADIFVVGLEGWNKPQI